MYCMSWPCGVAELLAALQKANLAMGDPTVIPVALVRSSLKGISLVLPDSHVLLASPLLRAAQSPRHHVVGLKAWEGTV